MSNYANLLREIDTFYSLQQYVGDTAREDVMASFRNIVRMKQLCSPAERRRALLYANKIVKQRLIHEQKQSD